MAEIIACLSAGKVLLLRQGQAATALSSPYQERASAHASSPGFAPVVGITRGRSHGQLYYAVRIPEGTAVLAQEPGVRDEQQLFLAVDARISELDFSFADEALACTVEGPRGTAAIGSFADDGKGVRTVTEGDVVDRCPRWDRPGGRAELVYASAGIGRTKSGAWGGLSPFAVNRLRFADSSVEVLLSDARFDYLSPIATSESELYALRSPYRVPAKAGSFAAVTAAILGIFRAPERPTSSAPHGRELQLSTPQGVRTIAQGVEAFDVAANGDVVYATSAGVFRLAPRGAAEPLLVSELVLGGAPARAPVTELVIM